MNYEELVGFVKESIKKTAAKNPFEKSAVEFNVRGECEGAFYVSTEDKTVTVAPYEYYDRDAKITLSADELIKLVKKEKTPMQSLSEGMITIEGKEDAVMRIFDVFKTPRKKADSAGKTVKAEKVIVDMTKASKQSKVAEDIQK